MVEAGRGWGAPQRVDRSPSSVGYQAWAGRQGQEQRWPQGCQIGLKIGPNLVTLASTTLNRQSWILAVMTGICLPIALTVCVCLPMCVFVWVIVCVWFPIHIFLFLNYFSSNICVYDFHCWYKYWNHFWHDTVHLSHVSFKYSPDNGSICFCITLITKPAVGVEWEDSHIKKRNTFNWAFWDQDRQYEWKLTCRAQANVFFASLLHTEMRHSMRTDIFAI